MLKIIEVVSLTSPRREIRLKGMQFLTRESSMGPRGTGRHAARASRRLSTFALLALTLVAAGAGMHEAFAQDPSSAPPPSADRMGPADLGPPQKSGAGEDNLSPDEMLAKAKQFVAGIEQASGSISRQLQAARKERDVVRVLCLNDKLNQVDVALGSAQDRLGSLRTAAERADVDRTKHEYTVLEVLNDRVRVLVNESNQCVGEETGFIGEAEVSVSVDPNLPNADTTGSAAASAPPPPPNISSPVE
jgi:hypothetical protein